VIAAAAVAPARSPARRVRRPPRSRVSLGLGLVRFGLGLRRFARERIGLADAERLIQEGMRTREARFLDLVDRAVLRQPRSPYRALMQAAGCEAGDLGALVRREGLEGALGRLHDAGVYVSYEEFKGIVPAVRGARRFDFREGDFDNPLVTPHLPSRSGGSSWRPSRIVIDLDLIAQMTPHWAIWFAAHGVLGEPLVFVNPFYPAAITHQLMCLRFGNRFVAWFATGGGGSPAYRLAARYVHAVARRVAGFAPPQPVSPDDLGPVARCLAALAADGRHPAVNTSPGLATRTSLAAQDAGLTLSGVTFMLGAEPLTAARKASIEASGARATVTYGFSEGGNVGSQCAAPAAIDDVHVSLDAYSVLARERTLPDGTPVSALRLTSLRTATPKVLLNTEIGDHAVLEDRACGCRFDALGYTRHLHTIRSFGKLTGDGVTFIGADVLRLLEETLPRQFGGSSADYQLVEEATADGVPRYALRVSPTVGPLDERAVAAAFLARLAGLRPPYRFMVDQWTRAGALRVVRASPEAGARGKVSAFLPLRSR
jgi:hypothetical protein